MITNETKTDLLIGTSGTSHIEVASVTDFNAQENVLANLAPAQDLGIPYTVGASGVIQDITYATLGGQFNGPTGNLMSVYYFNGATAGAEVVTINNLRIDIQIQSGVSTATQVQTAFNTVMSALPIPFLSATITGTGSNTQTSPAYIQLSGGSSNLQPTVSNLGGPVNINPTNTPNFFQAADLTYYSVVFGQAIIDNFGLTLQYNSNGGGAATAIYASGGPAGTGQFNIFLAPTGATAASVANDLITSTDSGTISAMQFLTPVITGSPNGAQNPSLVPIITNFTAPDDESLVNITSLDPNGIAITLKSLFTGDTAVLALLPDGNIESSINGTVGISQDKNQNVALGAGSLATTATNGFIYIPTTSGIPTGVPTNISGFVPMQFDTSTGDLYIYNGGWKKITLT